MKQRIVISGSGGQDVHFLTRLLADAVEGEEALFSEVHGMAMREGSVLLHLKVGGFRSPLLRPGEADILFVLDEENSGAHSPFLKQEGIAFVNTPTPGAYRSVPASAIAVGGGGLPGGQSAAGVRAVDGKAFLLRSFGPPVSKGSVPWGRFTST